MRRNCASAPARCFCLFPQSFGGLERIKMAERFFLSLGLPYRDNRRLGRARRLGHQRVRPRGMAPCRQGFPKARVLRQMHRLPGQRGGFSSCLVTERDDFDPKEMLCSHWRDLPRAGIEPITPELDTIGGLRLFCPSSRSFRDSKGVLGLIRLPLLYSLILLV